MRRIGFSLLLVAFSLVTSCQSGNSSGTTPPLSKQEQVQNNLDTLQATAHTGDLLVRLTDEIISQQISTLNEKDKSFSHCGLVVEKPNGKYVYHIAPNLPGADTIELIPLKKFIQPDSTIRCALYRYQLTNSEIDSLSQIIENYRVADIRFDPVYDLATNDKLYCSEMISKALNKATSGRMQFNTINVPERMQKLLVMFFKKQHLTKEIIATRKFVSLDNLYLRPDCKELMRFDLKIFPGQ